MENSASGGLSQEHIDHVKRLRRDVAYMAPKLLKVQTFDGELKPLVLNGPQLLIDHIFKKIKKVRLLRAVILKGRRMGMTTYISARLYQKTSFYPNRYAMQVTQEPQASEFVFKMVKRYYDKCPASLRPTVRSNNARLLEFNNKSGTGLDSAFRVATAGKDDLGSSQLIHYLHCSELSKWPAENIDDLLTAVLQCVPKKANTEIVFESTAKGIGGEFYDRFWHARYRVWVTRLSKSGNAIISETINPEADEENDYTSIFLPWFVFGENRMEPPRGFRMRGDETKMARRFGLSAEQVYWRRYTIANECRGSVETFKQEHPSTPEEAFLGTGRPVFNNTEISKQRDHAPEPKVRYEIHGGVFMAKDGGRLKVWQEPNHGSSYILAADVAEGLKAGDFSYASVIDWRSGEQVAAWHGHCDPDEFAVILDALGRRYNNALLAPERNNHGLLVVSTLFSLKYPKLYCEKVPDPPGKPRKRYGWLTTKATRPLIIDNLIQEAREGTHGIKDRELFGEMLSFKIQDDGKYEADTGRFDDRVIACAIAKYLRQVTPLPAMRKSEAKKLHREDSHPRNWA